MLARYGGLLALLFAAECLAGGTVDVVELERLFKKQAALRTYLFSTLDIEPTAYAEVRLGPQFKHLSGARIGPYHLRAKTKTGTPMEVVLCTSHRFLDASNKPVTTIEEAHRVYESLNSVVMREVGHADLARCP